MSTGIPGWSARWWRRRPTAAATTVALLVTVMVGCASSSSGPSPGSGSRSGSVASAAPQGDPPGLVYLALGDSNVHAAPDDCGRCTSYPHLVRDGLVARTGGPVTLIDASQHNRLTAAGLLAELTSDNWRDDPYNAVRTELLPRAAVAGADVITLTVSANTIPWYQDPDSCGAVYDAACVAAIQKPFAAALDGALAQIADLRQGRPTAIRVTTFYNDLLAGPEYAPEKFFSAAQIAQGPTTARAFLDIWNGAICSIASAHGAVCIDLYRDVNGPNGDTALPAGYFTPGPATSDRPGRIALRPCWTRPDGRRWKWGSGPRRTVDRDAVTTTGIRV